MGGRGSGRLAWRAKAEHALKLDINKMKKQDCLRPGLSITSRWTWNSGDSSSITILTREKAIELIYRVKFAEEDWQDRHQFIMLAHTKCNYGGTRAWFICPQCFRRIGVLYFQFLFLCRHCLGLVYSCKSEKQAERMRRKANKIRDRLNTPYGFQNPLRRTKWMHKNTFILLKFKVLRLESQALLLEYEAFRKVYMRHQEDEMPGRSLQAESIQQWMQSQ